VNKSRTLIAKEFHMKSMATIFPRALMGVFGVSFVIIGLIHFVAPVWYHDLYGMHYDPADVYDVSAARSIGTFATALGVAAVLIMVYWQRAVMAIRFVGVFALAFTLAHIEDFLHGNVPWFLAGFLIVCGTLFLLSKIEVRDS
jgi:hypothetical protein